MRFACGIATVRGTDAHGAAMTVSAAYITTGSWARDEIDWNPEGSRRGRGFAVYAAVRELGLAGFEALVDRCCADCHAIVTGIGGLPGAVICWVPQLKQGLERFLDRRPEATWAVHDRRTDTVIAEITLTGEAFSTGTTCPGHLAMRVSVVKWRTTDMEVARADAAARGVLQEFALQIGVQSLQRQGEFRRHLGRAALHLGRARGRPMAHRARPRHAARALGHEAQRQRRRTSMHTHRGWRTRLRTEQGWRSALRAHRRWQRGVEEELCERLR